MSQWNVIEWCIRWSSITNQPDQTYPLYLINYFLLQKDKFSWTFKSFTTCKDLFRKSDIFIIIKNQQKRQKNNLISISIFYQLTLTIAFKPIATVKAAPVAEQYAFINILKANQSKKFHSKRLSMLFLLFRTLQLSHLKSINRNE